MHGPKEDAGGALCANKEAELACGRIAEAGGVPRVGRSNPRRCTSVLHRWDAEALDPRWRLPFPVDNGPGGAARTASVEAKEGCSRVPRSVGVTHKAKPMSPSALKPPVDERTGRRSRPIAGLLENLQRDAAPIQRGLKVFEPTTSDLGRSRILVIRRPDGSHRIAGHTLHRCTAKCRRSSENLSVWSCGARPYRALAPARRPLGLSTARIRGVRPRSSGAAWPDAGDRAAAP
jgi:hypothetical protein